MVENGLGIQNAPQSLQGPLHEYLGLQTGSFGSLDIGDGSLDSVLDSQHEQIGVDGLQIEALVFEGVWFPERAGTPDELVLEDVENQFVLAEDRLRQLVFVHEVGLQHNLVALVLGEVPEELESLLLVLVVGFFLIVASVRTENSFEHIVILES